LSPPGDVFFEFLITFKKSIFQDVSLFGCPCDFSFYWDIARVARCEFLCFYSAVFLADESSFHFFANNSKTAGRRKLKFSHNVSIYQN